MRAPNSSPVSWTGWLPAAVEIPGYPGHRLVEPFAPCGKPGGFGVVFRGSCTFWPGRKFAFKFVANRDDIRWRPVEEFRYLDELNHDHIVQTGGYLILPPEVRQAWWPAVAVIVMKYAEHNLETVLEVVRRNGETLPDGVAERYLFGLADALDYLHARKRIVHRDIKPQNVLVKLPEKVFFASAVNLGNSEALLADLGTAVRIGDPVRMHMSCEEDDPKRGYKAPEVLDERRRDGYADKPHQDIYSLGLLMAEMRGHLGRVPEWYDPLLGLCCQDEPERRPTAAEVRNAIATGQALGPPAPRGPAPPSTPTGDTVSVAGGPTPIDGELDEQPLLLGAYVDWIGRTHRFLNVRSDQRKSHTPELDLEWVYVALKADRATAAERQASAESLLDPAGDEDPEALLARLPLLAALVERDRPGADPFAQHTSVVTLAEAFATERVFVLLGGPGSGKTTLLRWLARKLAAAVLDGHRQVTVPAEQANPDASEKDAAVNLGPARLPVLLRAADLVERLPTGDEPNPEHLTAFLGRNGWFDRFPTRGDGSRHSEDALNALVRRHLAAGTAVVLLDGLDEIPNPTQRTRLLRTVEAFARQWVLPHTGLPRDTGGNQLVVTSRVAGYHAAPLSLEVPHLTVEPMRRAAVERFCDQWFLAVARAELAAAGEETMPEEQAAQAKRDAGRLKQDIFDPARPGVAELATNPLLITIMASVFLEKKRLPDHRTDLYRQAFELLAEKWREFPRVNAERLAFMLAPVATYIHERYASGLLPRKEFEEQLTASLIDDNYKLRVVPDQLKNTLGDYLTAAARQSGVLAERGSGVKGELYGFVHLTFQEYLVGLDLLRRRFQPDGTRAVADAMLARAADPRWREPILLALGTVGAEHRPPGEVYEWDDEQRAELLLALLAGDPADPLRGLVPRVELLVARGIGEMAVAPDAAVRRVVAQLARWYADPAVDVAPQVRKQVENAVARFQSHPTRKGPAEAALVAALADPALAAPTAVLLRQLDWFTTELAAALLAALDAGHDRLHLGWPIHAALRASVVPALVPPAPKKPYVSDSDLDMLRREKPAEYEDVRRNLMAAQAAYPEQLARHLAAKDRPPVVYPPLPFRDALMGAGGAALVEHVTAHPDWLRVVVAVYGGYEDHRAVEVFRDYREIARWLQQPDVVREEEIARNREEFVSRFGHDDMVYNAAVYLDTKMGGRLDRAQRPPVFAPSAIVRDSKLTPRVLALLAARADTAALDRALREGVAGPDAELATDAAVGLIALGCDPDELPLDSLPALAGRLDQLRSALCDPITRALRQPGEYATGETNKSGEAVKGKTTAPLAALRAVDPPPPGLWEGVFAALAGVTVAYTDGPVSAEPLLPLPPPLNHLPLAEYWAERFACSTDDDAIYHLAVGLDRLTATPPGVLAASFARLPRAANLTWPGAFIDWPVDPLTGEPSADDPVPSGVIDAAEVLRTDAFRPGFRQVVRSEFLNVVRKLVPAHPQLLPELLVVNWWNWASAAKLFEGTGLSGQPAPADVRAQALALSDPYHSARALLRLNAYQPNADVRGEAVARIGRLVDRPDRRAELLERYLATLPFGGERERVVCELTAAARHVPPGTAAAPIALARAVRVNGEERVALLREAVAAAEAIPDPERRADVLLTLRPYTRRLSEARAAARRLPEFHRATALGRRGPWLREAEGLFRVHSPEVVPAWACVVLGGYVLDALDTDAQAESAGDLWHRYPTEPATALAQLLAAGAEGGLPLNRAAAEVIDWCGRTDRGGDLAKLLPLLQDPTADALPLVEGWIDAHPDRPLGHYAALYLAEPTRRVDGRTVGGLLALMESKDDRTRLRACLTLQGGIVVLKRERRELTASALGGTTLRRVAEHTLALGRQAEDGTGGVWRAEFLYGLLQDTLFDVPAHILEWADAVRGTGDEAAARLLAHIHDATPEVWQAVIAAYVRGGESVRSPILRSLLRVALNENEPWTVPPAEMNWPTAIPVVEDSTFHILPKLPCPVLAVIRSVREAGGELLPERLSADLARLAVHPSAVLADPTDRWPRLTALADETVWVYDRAFPGNIHHSKVNLWQMVADEPADTVSVLTRWLAAVLAAGADDPGLYPERAVLLFTLSLFATRTPELFARAAHEHGLEPLLRSVVRRHRWAPARIAAVRLLGKLSAIEPDTVQVLFDALADEMQTREVVQEVFTRLPRLARTELTPLFDGLHSESGMAVAAAAKALAAVANSEQADGDLRRAIQDGLADAYSRIPPDRGVYELAGGGTGEDNHRRVVYRGPLRRELLTALLAVTGGV